MARTTSDIPESEPYRLATSPSHLLHRAEQLAADRFARLVGDAITLRQFSVLAAIAEAPGLSQSDLVRATGVDRSTLADMMSRMERNNWIKRAESPLDARAYSVRLAPAGARILSTTAQQARAADAAILDLLPRGKRKSFLATLSKLLNRAEEQALKSERDARRRAKREARDRTSKKTAPRQKSRRERL